MKLFIKFPCRLCLVKSMCKESCNKLEEFDEWVTSEKFMIYTLSSLMFLLMICIVLLVIKSWWFLLSIPIIWFVSHIILVKCDIVDFITWNDIKTFDKETMYFLLLLPAGAFVISTFFKWFEKFYNKHAPVEF